MIINERASTDPTPESNRINGNDPAAIWGNIYMDMWTKSSITLYTIRF